MTERIDLHTHSLCSDGTLSPSELAQLAKKSGICAVALTDHDTVSGTEDFLAECAKLGIEGIKGIEISTNHETELHIIGLYVGGEEFNRVLLRLKDARKERNIKLVEKLREFGFDINIEEVLAVGERVTLESAGRPHIARALVDKGYASDIGEVFEKLIKRGRPCYVEKYSLSPEESIRLIKNCGGIAIWAHPFHTVKTAKEVYQMALELKSFGLDAMECRYSKHTDEQTRICCDVAEKAGLLTSGGSDFHGENRPEVRLGEVNGGCVPYELLEELKKILIK